MPWSKIGGPAHSLAIFANRLAALTPDKQAVYMRDPSSGQWQQSLVRAVDLCLEQA